MKDGYLVMVLIYNVHVVKFANGTPAHMFSLSQDSYPGHKSSPALVYKVFKICKIGNQNRSHLKHIAHNIVLFVIDDISACARYYEMKTLGYRFKMGN